MVHSLRESVMSSLQDCVCAVRYYNQLSYVCFMGKIDPLVGLGAAVKRMYKKNSDVREAYEDCIMI